jgi:hypothetical protein
MTIKKGFTDYTVCNPFMFLVGTDRFELSTSTVSR